MKVNNDYRRAQHDRFVKYALAAQNLGIEIPKLIAHDELAVIMYLSKSNHAGEWDRIVAEAARLFPETFQTEVL